MKLFSERKNIIVLDTETTGLDTAEDELLQVSIIDSTGSVVYDSYIRPTRTQQWPEAEQVNHISPAMVADAPTIVEVLPQIQKIILEADCIIGYNTTFDIDFLRWAGCEFQDWCGDDSTCLIIDVMELFAPIYGMWIPYRSSYKWQSLSKAADYYGYYWGEASAHNSLGDCLATLYIWQKMLENGDAEAAVALIQTACEQG